MAESTQIHYEVVRGVIYGLHSGDHKIRYVGQTTRLRQRLNEHRFHSQSKSSIVNDPLSVWIRSIEVLHLDILEDQVLPKDLNDVESKWIVKLGGPLILFNKTPGGVSMPKGSEAAWFGKKHEESTRQKMREWHKDHKHPMFGKPSPRAVFSDNQALEIIRRVKTGERRAAIAREFQVSRSTIELLVKGVTYSWLSRN